MREPYGACDLDAQWAYIPEDRCVDWVYDWEAEVASWKVMEDHYRTLYLTSPGFRDKINWQAATYREMVLGGRAFGRVNRLDDPKARDRIEYQLLRNFTVHQNAILEVLQEIGKKSPATAAETRHKGDEPVFKKYKPEEVAIRKSILWGLL